MDGLVIFTGMNTYFGETAKLVGETEIVSHLKKAVVKIGDYLIIMAGLMVTIIFIVALLRHESILKTIEFALVLVVVSIPVALPAVLSVTLAVGAIALAKKEAIVSKLVSIEEMAGVDVLCTDKTGTITQNKLSIAEVESFPNFSDRDVILYATLASQRETKDPIDHAIVYRSDEIMEDVSNNYNISNFKPFDPVIKRTEASIEYGNRKFKVAKGAAQVIMSLTDDDIADDVNRTVNKFADKGYRSLGVGKTDKNDEWHYIGTIALHDPPRDDSAETIKTAQSLGGC